MSAPTPPQWNDLTETQLRSMQLDGLLVAHGIARYSLSPEAHTMLWEEMDRRKAEVARLTAALGEAREKERVRIFERIHKADVETLPDPDPFDEPRNADEVRGENNEAQRWSRILTAVRLGLICNSCGAPAHRGESGEKLNAALAERATGEGTR